MRCARVRHGLPLPPHKPQISIFGYFQMTKSQLEEVSFGTATIQKLRRITLDQNLLRTLQLEEGDCVDVVLLTNTGEICLRKHQQESKKMIKKGR